MITGEPLSRVPKLDPNVRRALVWNVSGSLAEDVWGSQGVRCCPFMDLMMGKDRCGRLELDMLPLVRWRGVSEWFCL